MSRTKEYLYEVQQGREKPYTSANPVQPFESFEDLDRFTVTVLGMEPVTAAGYRALPFQVGQKVRTNGPKHWQQGHYGTVVKPGSLRSEVEFPSGVEKWPNAWLQAW